MKNKINVKELLKDKKNLYILIGVVVIVVIIGLLIFFLNKDGKSTMSPETLESKLTALGKDAYENHYYEGLTDEQKETTLPLYTELGIKLNMTNLEVLVSIDEDVKSQLENDNCSFEDTKVVFYPKEPFGREDYDIEIELSCEE